MDNIFPSYDLAHSIQDLVEMIHDLVYKLQEGVLLVRAESIQYVQSVYLAHNIFRSQDLTLVVQELVKKKDSGIFVKGSGPECNWSMQNPSNRDNQFSYYHIF